MVVFDDSEQRMHVNDSFPDGKLSWPAKTRFVRKGGGSVHKDGTLGEGSGGARANAGRKSGRNLLQAYFDKFDDTFGAAKVEHASVISKTGNVVYWNISSQSKKQVDFPDSVLDEIESMQYRSAIMTHNHPNGFSLSKEDYIFGLEHNMSGVRSVGPYGGVLHSYYMDFNHKPVTTSAFERIFDKETAAIENILWKRVDKEELNLAQANFVYGDMVSKTLAKKFGWVYKHDFRR